MTLYVKYALMRIGSVTCQNLGLSYQVGSSFT